MTLEEYYTAPPDHIFEEIKRASIKLWSEYDDTYGYATSKIDRIKDMENIQDNAWYIVLMFDYINTAKLISRVSPETAWMILSAMTPSTND